MFSAAPQLLNGRCRTRQPSHESCSPTTRNRSGKTRNYRNRRFQKESYLVDKNSFQEQTHIAQRCLDRMCGTLTGSANTYICKYVRTYVYASTQNGMHTQTHTCTHAHHTHLGQVGGLAHPIDSTEGDDVRPLFLPTLHHIPQYVHPPLGGEDLHQALLHAGPHLRCHTCIGTMYVEVM